MARVLTDFGMVKELNKKMNHLLEIGIIKMNSNKHDPALTYSLNI